ncbi:hypothetical protein SFRURICE_016970 [Spodoptera frugiperda]|nr:hypothetical protein SFRURICE_016970 [Spodoptera frugiperda]
MVTKIRAIPNRLTVLQKDCIDREIQRVVYPFNAVLTLVFCSKYSIHNNNISPRGSKYCIVRFLGIFFVIAVTVFRMYTTMTNMILAQRFQDPTSVFLSICLPGLNFAGYLITFIVNIVHGHNNVLFIKIIQNVNKNITFRDINSFILWNWISLGTIICIDISFYILLSLLLNYLSAINGICEIFFSIIDIDFVYTIRLQLLLTKYLKEWIDKIRSILYRIFNAFFRNLCILQLYLSFVENVSHFYTFYQEVPYTNFVLIIVIVAAMAKLVSFVMIHSQYNEKFNMMVEDVNVTCVLRMKNVNCSKLQKQFCKNVLRENETFSKMTACGLFYIDGRLPLICKVIPKAFSKPNEPANGFQKHVLGKEYQRILYPYNLFLTLFFSSKYFIRGNQISPIGNCTIFLQSLACFYIVAVSIYILTLSDIFFFIPNGNISIVRFISIFLPTTRCINFIINFILNIRNRHNNVLFIVLMQNIHENVKPIKMRRFIILNWIFVSILVLIIALAFILVSRFVQYHDNLKTVCEIIMVCFEIDFIYSIRVLVLLSKYVEHWIKNVDLMSEDRVDSDEVYCKKLFATYVKILEAFDVYKVLYRVINAFGRNLCFVEFMLQVVKIKEQNNGKLPTSSVIMGFLSLMAIVKDLVQVGFHCVYCEKFYIALEDAEEACLRLMKNGNYTKGQEELCMDVVWENRKFNKMTACGLFNVDAKLPLSLLEYFASYAIRILFPFNFFLTLFSCPKYSIRDNYITPNGNKTLIFQLFGICFVTAITIDLLGLTNLATFLPSGNAFIIKLISIFLNLTRWFNFISNAILNIKNSLDNVCLIIMIQSIYKSVKVTGVFSFTVVNWIIVTIPIFIMVSASMSVAIIFSVIPNFFHNACTYILISYEIDFLYNTRILHLLCKYIDHWIKKIDLMTNDREDDEAYCLKLFETYQNILKAYEMYKKLYEVVILIRIMIAFCRNLCFFGYALQVIKQEQHDGKLSLPTLIMGALSMLGIVKDFVEVGFYCIICEKFYIALEEAEGACIRRIMNVNYTKVLLDNCIRQDIYKIFFPINCLLFLLCSPKYSIRDGFITPNGKKLTILSFLSVCYVLVISIYYRYCDEMNDRLLLKNRNSIVTAITYFYSIYYCFGVIMVFILNIVHSQNNILFIIMFNAIDSNICHSMSARMIICNWVAVISVFGINFFIYFVNIISVTHYDGLRLSIFFSNLLFSTSDVNLLYAIQALCLLENYLKEWTKKVLVSKNECDVDKLSKIYLIILEAYNLYKSIFQVLLFRTPLLGCATVLWMAKDLLLVITHCIQCEKFYSAIEEAETACIQLMKNNNSSQNQVLLCKKVLQANRTFTKMTACGLFCVDAKLPLCLLALLTGYQTVVSTYITNELQEHRINQDFKKIFYPLHLILVITSASRYKIRSDLVTPISKKFIVIQFIFVFGVQIASSLHELIFISNNINFTSDLLYWILIWIGCCLSFVEEFFYRHDNYLLILSFQEIHKAFDYNKRFNSYLTRNWIFVLAVYFFNVLMTFVIYTNPEKFDLLKWISDLVCIKFDVVFIVAYRVLALLTLYVDEWIKCVRRLDNGNNNEPIEFHCEKLLKTYDNIIKSYDMFKKVFQISVLFYTMDSFGRTVLYTKIILNINEYDVDDMVLFSSILSFIWFAKNFIMLTIYNVQCEQFYMKVEEAQSASIQFDDRLNSESEKFFRRRILQRNCTFTKMTACGLFYVDAMLPIRFLLLTTNHVINLLTE